MITIVICNQKGGVGKTTTAAAVATGLFNRGRRVLMVDADPQSNLSYANGINVLEVPCTLYDVFEGEAAIQDAIQPVKVPGLDIITGGLDLAIADSHFTQPGREMMLLEKLEDVKDQYDFCIVDTGPNLGILASNAMTAADFVVVPMTSDMLALQGMMQLSGFIRTIKKYFNSKLEIAGIVLTMYDSRTVLSKVLEDTINQTAEEMGTKVFSSRIRRAQAVSNAIAVQEDIYSQAPNAKATQDYSAFIDELLETIEG